MLRRRSLPALALALGLGIATTVSGMPAATGAASIRTESAAAGSSQHLPFDMPSASTLRASERKVFAHYVPWFPLSIDNKEASVDYYTRNYLAIDGEDGKYAAWGGKQRDRPFIRPPVNDPEWELRDFETEVRQAIAAGLDGFVVSIVSFTSKNWERTKLLMQAAQNVDPAFKIMPRPNMIVDAVGDQSASEFAESIAELARYSSAYRLSDGRLVLSPFRAELDSVSWWQSALNALKNNHGVNVAFWPMFLNEMTYGEQFSAISYGQATWGERNAKNNDPANLNSTGKIGRLNTVQARGDKWMQPVSLQDVRPTQEIYWEAENSLNLRRTWQIAIDGGADMVHIPTWNDYAEGSHTGPSAKMGWAPSDISAYYLTWYKTGTQPRIVRDTVYLSHRKMPTSARPSAHSRVMDPADNTPVYDRVEALTFLTSPATVRVKVGSQTTTCEAPAGIASCLAPLGTGQISTEVVRGGNAVAGTVSPHTVTNSPAVQDLDYVFTSSGRKPSVTGGGGGGGGGATGTSAVVTPIADTYANEKAESKNYGSSYSLASRGDAGYIAYMKFDLPDPPSGRSLTGAVLRISTKSDDFAGSDEAHEVRFADNDWSENGLTWDNRTALHSLVGTLQPGTVPNSTYDIRLDAGALAWLQGSEQTLAITGTGSDNVWFKSRSDDVDGPQLLLTYG